MTATALSRRAPNGRFAPRPVWPTCTECRSILAENLLGELRCLRQCCENFRVVVDVVPGVRLGTLTAADLEVEQ
jgi:hypothetical protein